MHPSQQQWWKTDKYECVIDYFKVEVYKPHSVDYWKGRIVRMNEGKPSSIGFETAPRFARVSEAKEYILQVACDIYNFEQGNLECQEK